MNIPSYLLLLVEVIFRFVILYLSPIKLVTHKLGILFHFVFTIVLI